MSKRMQIIWTIVFYGVDIALSTVIFIVLFHTPFLKKVDVFFYRGCFLLIIAGLCSILICSIGRKVFQSLEMGIKDCACVFFLFMGITLGWFILAPVTVERSISVYMLSFMEENDEKGITAGQFGDIFYDKYITDYGAFDKRFHEQVASGTIEADENGEYKITDSGRRIVSLFRLCADLFDTEQWLVHPGSY